MFSKIKDGLDLDFYKRVVGDPSSLLIYLSFYLCVLMKIGNDIGLPFISHPTLIPYSQPLLRL